MDTITGDLFEFCAITNAAREAVNRATGGTDAEDLLKAGWKLAFADKSYKCMRDIIRFQVSVRDQAGEEQVLVVKLKQNDPNKKPARKNPKPYYTYGVDREDGSQRPYQRLWDFAYVSDSAYKQLMDLALPEPWSFTDRDGGHEILSWYLNGTFLHLLDEEKIRYGQDAQGKFAVFCTGLVNRNFEDIYCFCEPNSKAKAEWIVKSFCTKGSGNAGKRLVRARGEVIQGVQQRPVQIEDGSAKFLFTHMYSPYFAQTGSGKLRSPFCQLRICLSVRFLDGLHDPRDGRAQNRVHAKLHEEIHADKCDEEIIDDVRSARKVLQNGAEDCEHANGENTCVHNRRADGSHDAAERLVFGKRLIDESRDPAAEHGLSDTDKRQPEGARHPKQVCKLVGSGNARDQADNTEYTAKERACARAKEDRTHDDGNQRQGNRHGADFDTGRDGLQDDHQRSKQRQRRQTDNGCVFFVFHTYLQLSLRHLRPDAMPHFFRSHRSASANRLILIETTCLCLMRFPNTMGKLRENSRNFKYYGISSSTGGL